MVDDRPARRGHHAPMSLVVITSGTWPDTYGDKLHVKTLD